MNLIIKIAIIALVGIFSKQSFCNHIIAGIASIDQGDDVYRPGALIEAGINPENYIGLFTYGRTFGDVHEVAYTLHYGWTLDIFGSMPFFGRIGPSLLDEITTIKNQSISDTEHNYNIGAFLGIGYRYQFDQFILQANWDSHLYPAGLNGFLLMATGRKQTIGLLIGVSI